MSTKAEFSIKMLDQDSAQKVKDSLSNVTGLTIIDVDLPKQRLLVELNVTSNEGLEQIQKRIENKTGFTTVLKGFGSEFAAVAELHEPKRSDDISKSILGVVRLTQLTGEQCFVDAVIDHLPENQINIAINIHQFGDLSHPNLAGVGPVHIPINDNVPVRNCHVYFKQILSKCDLSACIGRSLVVGSSNKHLAAGIIARASPVSGNEKKICLCSGKTIWQERQEMAADQNQKESHHK